MSFLAAFKVNVFKTRKRMCMCDMRSVYRWGSWAKCRLCYRICSWIPVVFILAVVAWSYYAYVFVLCLSVVDNIFIKIAYLILYHAVVIPFLWAYYQVVFKSPGEVPHEFRLSADACDRMRAMNSLAEQNRFLNDLARGLPVLTRSFDDNVRFCDICAQVKPDRSHHCSVCGTCILKMDHHCPWVNNCVGYANYKFFLLFLFYALVLCAEVALTVLPDFIQFWKTTGMGVMEGPRPGEADLNFGSRFNVLFLFFVAVMFAISVTVLLAYHLHLVSRNRSTLESFRPPVFPFGPDKSAFDLGCKQNWEQVFGPRKALWLVPVTTCMGDGVVFPVRPGIRGSTYASVDNTGPNPLQVSASGDGLHGVEVDYSLRSVITDSGK